MYFYWYYDDDNDDDDEDEDDGDDYDDDNDDSVTLPPQVQGTNQVQRAPQALFCLKLNNPIRQAALHIVEWKYPLLWPISCQLYSRLNTSRCHEEKKNCAHSI